MEKEAIKIRMKKYHSVLEEHKVKDHDIERFSDWITRLTPEELEDIPYEECPGGKRMMDVAAKTGVLKKVLHVTCPFCQEMTGAFTLMDQEVMPPVSECSNGHQFRTLEPNNHRHVYGIRRRVPFTIY